MLYYAIEKVASRKEKRKGSETVSGFKNDGLMGEKWTTSDIDGEKFVKKFANTRYCGAL